MIEQLLSDLSRPEYLHVILNPIPIYGTAAGLLGLIASLFIRNPLSKIPPLIILLISGLLVIPVVQLGEKAENQVESSLTDDGREWIEAHEHRAHQVLPVFYALAAFSLAAIILAWKFPRTTAPATVVVALIALGALAAGFWVGHAGGKIMHREFQTTTPPATPEHEH